MATSVLIAGLKLVPWSKVLENAPMVADTAIKLWNKVANRSKPDSPPGKQTIATANTSPSESDLLTVRVQTLEERVKILQDQIQVSSELIKELAEQNTQLVLRIEMNRARLVRLMIATALGGTLLLSVIMYILFAGRA